MMDNLGIVLIVGAGAATAWYFWPRKTGGVEVTLTATGQTTKTSLASLALVKPAPKVEMPVITSGQVGAMDIAKMAYVITEQHFPAVDPKMVLAMAKIESSLNPKAYRFEPHLNDASIGLMQTLLKTAQWLYDDIGARAYGRPMQADLEKAEVSLYFGAAYINWLRRYRGIARSEEWIVRAYNGGPGWEKASQNSKSMTLNHWNKYRKARYG